MLKCTFSQGLNFEVLNVGLYNLTIYRQFVLGLLLMLGTLFYKKKGGPLESDWRFCRKVWYLGQEYADRESGHISLEET